MKQVKEERLAIIIELTREGGIGSVEVTCRADYEVACGDCGQETNKTKNPLELTAVQETAIKNFGAEILQQIKALEE